MSQDICIDVYCLMAVSKSKKTLTFEHDVYVLSLMYRMMQTGSTEDRYLKRFSGMSAHRMSPIDPSFLIMINWLFGCSWPSSFIESCN